MRRIRKILTILAVLFAFGIGVSLLPRHTPSTLLDRATRVTSITGWNLERDDYHWVSNSQVLHFSGTNGDWSVMLFDLRSRSDRELSGLNRLFRRTGGLPETFSLSPDGTRALWDGGGSLNGATLKGKLLSRSAEHLPARDCWMGDSRHWVEVITQPRNRAKISGALVHAPDGARIERRLTFNPPLDVPLALSVTERDQLLLHIWSQPPDPRASTLFTISVDLLNESAGPKSFAIPLSKRAFSYASPYAAGGRVAWAESSLAMPSRLAFLWRRFLPSSFRERVPGQMTVWVSSLNGVGKRKVGTLEYHPPSNWLASPDILHWRPDGRSLSFIYEGSLYTVPTE